MPTQRRQATSLRSSSPIGRSKTILRRSRPRHTKLHLRRLDKELHPRRQRRKGRTLRRLLLRQVRRSASPIHSLVDIRQDRTDPKHDHQGLPLLLRQDHSSLRRQPDRSHLPQESRQRHRSRKYQRRRSMAQAHYHPHQHRQQSQGGLQSQYRQGLRSRHLRRQACRVHRRLRCRVLVLLRSVRGCFASRYRLHHKNGEFFWARRLITIGDSTFHFSSLYHFIYLTTFYSPPMRMGGFGRIS